MLTNTAGRLGAAFPGREKGMSTLALVLVIALALLLVGGGSAAALYAAGFLGGNPPGDDMADGAAQPQKPMPALYLPLEPPIVVNFSGDMRSGYLQASVELMAREQSVLDAVRTHMPVVRNDLILMLGDQERDALVTRAGKEQIRRDALAVVNEVLASRDIEGEVEAVYFTSFILQ